LVVENDPTFARFLCELARERGFKCLVSAHGTTALEMVQDFAPHAATLDIRLPDVDGWRVLNNLKSNLRTRHIPVTVISTDDEPIRGLRHGAFDVLSK